MYPKSKLRSTPQLIEKYLKTQDVGGWASLDLHSILKYWILSRLVLLCGQCNVLYGTQQDRSDPWMGPSPPGAAQSPDPKKPCLYGDLWQTPAIWNKSASAKAAESYSRDMSRESFGQERLKQGRGAPAPVLVGHLCIHLCLCHPLCPRSACAQRCRNRGRAWRREGGSQKMKQRERRIK